MTIYYLEMTDPSHLRPPSRVVEGFEARQAWVPYGVLNRFFYQEVGAAWQWTDRLPWSENDWQAYAERGGLETWVGYLRGTPVGYFELARQDEGQVEIAMFGVLPPFIGRGVGGIMLTAAIRRGLGRGGTAGVAAHRDGGSSPRPGQLPGARHADLQDRGAVRKGRSFRGFAVECAGGS